MVKVMFVCLGNICRSPMAEAVFRHIVKENNMEEKIFASSCGTAGYHVGEPPHQGTRRILDSENISYKNIFSSKLSKGEALGFDYVIAMDEENLGDIRRITGSVEKPTICLLSRFAKEDFGSVPDPWYTGDFQHTYDLVLRGCLGLFDHIKQEMEIVI